MGFILTLVALAIVAMGAMMIWKPDSVLGTVKLYADEIGFQVFASVGRILIGIAFLVYAKHADIPWLLTLIGAISLISGIVFFFLKQETFSGFIRKMINQYGDHAKIAGGVAVAVGLLLLYAI